MKWFSDSNAARFWNNIKTYISEKYVEKQTGKGLSTNDFTDQDKEKLDGLKNVTVDSSISSTSTNPVQNKVIYTELGKKVNTSQIGEAGGVAELDSSGKVPASQLPSYVDDVVEGYYSGGNFYSDSAHENEITPESGKIYIDITNNNNVQYRWSGSTYVKIESGGLTLGETSTTAYRGDRGKIAYDFSQQPHAPADAQKNVQSDWKETDDQSDAFIKNKPTSLPANGGDADTVNGHTVQSNVPKNAKFTDTTYSVFKGATSSAAGSSGLVPAPASGKTNQLMGSAGSWVDEMTDDDIDAICV